MKNLTWQNPEQLFVAQVLINKVKSKCCGIKVYKDFQTFLRKLLEVVAKITDKNIQKEFHQNYLSLNQMSEYIKIGSKNEIRQLKDQTRTLISLISSYSAEIN